MTLGGVIGVTTSVSRPGSINISTVDEAIAGGHGQQWQSHRRPDQSAGGPARGATRRQAA